MSLTITITTTANRQSRFVQHDPAEINAILSTLCHAGQLFSQTTLVIVGEQSTEIFNPSAITRLELATEIELAPYLPSGWLTSPGLRATPQDTPRIGIADDEGQYLRVDFFFNGGDTLATWLDNPDGGDANARRSRLSHLFTAPVIPYRLRQHGIGLINPANLTRAQAHAPLLYPPAAAWRAQEAE